MARELLRDALVRLRVKVFPSAANFLLVDFGADAPRIFVNWRRAARFVARSHVQTSTFRLRAHHNWYALANAPADSRT